MKLQISKEDWNKQGPQPTISYKADSNCSKTPTDKSDSLKADIKTQPG